MKFFFAGLFWVLSLCANSQDIIGKWYSGDSTRIYEIKKTQNGFVGTLFYSTRKNDTIGAIVLSDIVFNEKKNRYIGNIYSITHKISTTVKFKFKKNNSSVLYLRLRRMYFANFTLKWYRVKEENLSP